MSSHYAPFALMLGAAMCQLPTCITCMEQAITGVNHWLRGVIAATAGRLRRRCERSPESKRLLTAYSPRARGRSSIIPHYEMHHGK